MEYLIFHQYVGTWVLYGKYFLCHSNCVYKFVELKDTLFAKLKKHLIEIQSRPQSEFVALPLLWDTRGRSAI